ncbi:hypothetical protein EOD40_02405 [Flavobacterium sufflavum]|uniref:Uncharacterized protein n=1 Tax=Flavobacterium sufflavum TaxID=1921138 RepID=A0A437L3X0_9FLAO|nr:hypothetical protein [Flavobacterium sufflavum]RVT79985.1 hypothetical protein EOD40_02405 [Flavobacterium sufflavum]
MKLRTEQIEIIDQTLVLNGMVYDDVKLELIDHIATDIENQLENKETNFEVALKIAFENWSDQLHLGNSFWINSRKAIPRMLLDRWILETKKKFFLGGIIAIVLSILITFIEKILNSSTILSSLGTILRIVFSLELVTILVFRLIIWKSERKSFSGFLFQTQTRFAVLFILFLFCFKGMPFLISSPDLKINLISNFMGMFYMVVSLFFIQIALKHFQFIQKHKVS